MTRRLLPAAGMVALGAAVAASAGVASASAGDDRLLVHAFAQNEVVRIDGRTGVQATIAFGEGEAIENVAVGDSNAWQITPNKRADLLFLKPLQGSARTNMTVVTDRHTYLFDLVASPKARPVYLLRFTYRDAPKPLNGGLAPAEQAVLTSAPVPEPEPAKAAVDPATLNFAFRTKGDARILPARIYDDGNATYLLWGDKAQVPAILAMNEKGQEGPVNYSVQGRTIVVDEAPRLLLLRLGRARATVENQRPASSPATAQARVATAQPAPSAPAPSAREN